MRDFITLASNHDGNQLDRPEGTQTANRIRRQDFQAGLFAQHRRIV